MGHGASPNLHQEPTEAPRGWLRSASAASALLHNAQLVLLHPSTSWTRIDSKGQREQGPTHPPQWWDRGSAPTSGASERRYENEAAAPKKKAPQQKRSCCQPPRGESSTAESGTGLVTKTEAALQVMNSRHPPEQRPIPVKTQTKCQQKHLGFGALWSSVSLRKSPHSTDSPVVYTCIAAIVPGKTNSQKSSGMSVQAATSAPKPHRGCSSCILAPNGLRGQRGIYSRC